MGKPAKRRASTTPEERAAKKAFAVETKIKKGVGAIRHVWIALAAHFYEFYTEQMWVPLGHDKFEEWLGDPDIGLGRSQVYALKEVYEELIVKRHVDPEELGNLDASKIGAVLPAIRRGDVEVEDALADCAALSRSALKEKYGKATPAARVPLTECDECGKMCRAKSDQEADAVDPNQIALEEVDAT